MLSVLIRIARSGDSNVKSKYFYSHKVKYIYDIRGNGNTKLQLGRLP